MIKDIGFVIRPRFDGAAAQKGLESQSKLLRDQHKTLGKLGTAQSKLLKDAERGYREIHREAAGAGDAMKKAWERGAEGIEKFNKTVDGIKKRLFSLKAVIAETIVGEVVKSTIDAGAAVLRAKQRIEREFKGEGAERVTELGLKVARRAGLKDEDALSAIIPLAEAVQETQKGSRYANGRRIKTDAEAAEVRKTTLEKGAGLLGRIATVTGIDPHEVGFMLSEAGAGPEGMRRFAGTLGLSRVFARRAVEANQKGKLYDLLGADRAKDLGVKRGQRAGQGTILDALLQHSGITEEAAEARRHQFSFQKKAIGATLENVLGDIGEGALEKLNKGLGQGATLAERLQNYLKSEDGKKLIDKLASGVEKLVEGLIKAAEQLPKIIKFAEDHKTLLGVVGGGYVASRFLGSESFEGIKNIFSVGKKAGDVLSGAGGKAPIPVYVVNAPEIGGGGGGVPGGKGSFLGKAGLVVGAGLAGYAAGSYLDEKLGLSDKGSKGLFRLTGAQAEQDRVVELGGQQFREQLARKQADRLARVQDLMKGGLSKGQALYAADHPTGAFTPGHAPVAAGAAGDTHVQVLVQLDGMELAAHTEKHITRRAKNHTVGGAVPTYRGE